MANLKLKINTPMAGHKAGEIVTISVGKHGRPKDIFWRRRLRDAESDNCVEEVVVEQKKTAEPSSKSVSKKTKSTK